jgi:hypothetical protein
MNRKMEDNQSRQATYPVCKDHWERMRQEALSGMPFWSKPLARLRVKQVLNQKGFVQSDTECRFCQTKSDVDDVK